MEQSNDLKLNGKVVLWQHVRDVHRAKRWYADVLGMELEDAINGDICHANYTRCKHKESSAVPIVEVKSNYTRHARLPGRKYRSCVHGNQGQRRTGERNTGSVRIPPGYSAVRPGRSYYFNPRSGSG